MKIALFGGSFDPPHAGHDDIVREILKQNIVDKLLIVPTFINPFKQKFSAPPKLRLKWCQKMWGNLKNVIISDFEISQNKAVASIETVKFIMDKFSDKNLEIFLIIGADNLAKLHNWKDFEILNSLVRFIVVTRDGYEIPKRYENLQKINLNANMSSSSFRENLAGKISPLIKDEVIKFYKGLKMQERISKISEILSEKKCENIEIVDMSQRDYIAKYVIIATVLTGRHAFSLIDELKTKLKPDEEFLAVESSDEWSVIDLGDIIIHLMSEIYRKRYNIEDFLDKLKKEELN